MINIETLDPSFVSDWCQMIYKKMDFKNKYKGYGSFKVDLSNWIRENLSDLGIEWIDNDAFLQLMKLEFSELTLIVDWFKESAEIINKIDMRDRIFYPRFKQLEEFRKFEECLKYAYQNFVDSKSRLLKISSSNIKVCPYCNRNYINSSFRIYCCKSCKVENKENYDYIINDWCSSKCPEGHDLSVSDIKIINTCQLDHFFPKSIYPLFSVCYYNLIPICPSCNFSKLDNELNISPYDSSISIANLYRYNYDLTKLHQPRIYIEDSNVNSDESIFYKIESDFEKLHLVELYQSHIDIVNEIEWKNQIYSDNYKNEINKLIESAGLNILTKDEINRIITGVYTNIEHYAQRPLSKLITDISKNVGLI